MKEGIALLLALMRAGAGVRLVDDDEAGAGAGEILAAFLGLDVVKRDDGAGMRVEEGLVEGEATFEPGGGGGGDGGGVDAETGFQFAHPLVDEMGWAEDGEGLDLAPVDQFAQDESGLDGFADADVIGDEEAGDGLAQRHQERDELVGARLEREVGGRAEGARAAAEGQAERVGQEGGAELQGGGGVGRQGEGGGADTVRDFEGGVEEDRVVFATGERAEGEEVGLRRGQGDPLAVAGED